MKGLKIGDNVYFKRQDDMWHGPGKVIGWDGKQILVKHGGAVIRAHTFRLQSSQKAAVNENSPMNTVPTSTGNSNERACEGSDYELPRPPTVETAEDTAPKSAETAVESLPESPVSSSEDPGFICPSSNMKNPSIGQRIEFVDLDGQTKIAKVSSRAGKSTGKYKFCYNIETPSGENKWLDLFRDVQKWKPLPDENDVLITYENNKVTEAKKKELDNWQSKKVYEEVEDKDQRTVSLRWVITEKMDNNLSIIKARLVARGFEENMLQEQRRDSPTCTKDSLRTVMSVVASYNWECNAIDIKSAFLQGDPIEREVFVRPPKEFLQRGTVWKLKKNIYGLNDASRAWYFTMKKFLISVGMKMCSVDSAVFYYIHDGKLGGVVCMHVDDIFWAGTTHFSDSVITAIHRKFNVGSGSAGKFKYIGLEIKGYDDHITMSQNDYVQDLKPIQMDHKMKANRSSLLSDEELEEYRVVVGQLMWLANQTRPDIAFEVCELSTHCHNATVEDEINANKVVSKVKKRNVGLNISRLTDISQLTIECYCDASFANLGNGGSQGSYVIFLRDESCKRNICSWQSRKVRRVVKSTLAAETLALLDGAEASILLAAMISELLNLQGHRPIVKCFVDNRSLVDAVYSTKVIEDRLLRINMAMLRDLLARRELHEVTWVPTSCQLADALTKRGADAEPLIEAVSH